MKFVDGRKITCKNKTRILDKSSHKIDNESKKKKKTDQRGIHLITFSI